MTQELLYDKRGEIGWITFNRPQARNALTFAMYEGLAEICGRVGQTREVKALVITGAGDKAFAAGTDIAQFQAFKGGEDGIAYERKIDRILDTIERCSVPDHRRHRRLLHRRRGRDRGGLRLPARHHQRPVRLSHRPHAGQLPVDGQLRPAGRPDRPAARQGDDLPGQADRRVRRRCSIGLVSELLPDAAALHARAEEAGPHAWPAMRRSPCQVTKEALRRLQARLGDDDIDDLIRLAYGSADFREGMAAFLAKRAPKWSGT